MQMARTLATVHTHTHTHTHTGSFTTREKENKSTIANCTTKNSVVVLDSQKVGKVANRVNIKINKEENKKDGFIKYVA